MSETEQNDLNESSKIPRSKSFFPATVENPFVHRIEFTPWDKIKIAVMSVTIVPIRLIVIGILLVIGWIFAAITLYGRTDEDMKQPMRGWRSRMRGVVKWLGRALLFCCGFHHVNIVGQQASPEEAPIVSCAPHSTFFDLIISFVLKTLPGGVSRVENGRIFLFGKLTNFTQPVLVSREDPNSRQNTIKEINRRAQSGGEWPQIIIFPEGTCTNRSCLIAFKPGAFYPGAPVQPVCLKYKNKMDTVTWTWDGPGAFQVLWLTLCQLNNELEIEFLEVHKPNAEEIADPKLFARNVRDKMAECLQIPVTDHTFEDCRLMLYANKINFPAAAGLIEFHKISKKLGMNYDNLKELLTKFTEIAQEKKNAVTIEELANYMELPVSGALEEMFSLYDRDGSGTIDFREYVIGLHLVAEPANTEETIQFAFQVFDNGNKGYITKEELVEILHNAFSMDIEAGQRLFSQVDTDADGKITYDEFKTYAQLRPEYAKLFQTYHELQSQKSSKPSSQDLANGNKDSKVKAE